jgi:hypothetical protein
MQGRLRRRLERIREFPAERRIERRLLPSRSAVGERECRFRRRRQLHAAVGLAPGPAASRCAGRRALDLRSELPAEQHRGRGAVRLVLRVKQ